MSLSEVTEAYISKESTKHFQSDLIISRVIMVLNAKVVP